MGFLSPAYNNTKNSMLKGLSIMNTRIADYLGLFIIFTFYVLYFTLSPSRENPFIIFTVILLILSLISILTSFEELFTTFNKNPLIFRTCCITLILIGVFFWDSSLESPGQAATPFCCGITPPKFLPLAWWCSTSQPQHCGDSPKSSKIRKYTRHVWIVPNKCP